jgi:hypothetical protein
MAGALLLETHENEPFRKFQNVLGTFDVTEE